MFTDGQCDLYDPETYVPLHLFLRLTSIAISVLPSKSVVIETLRADPRLECIVFLVNGPPLVVDTAFEADVRLVCLRYDINYRIDWLRGAYWKVAHTFIAAKRAGTIKREHIHFTLQSPGAQY